MTKIVQSIVHLREFSNQPISTLGRRASVAGCSLLNEPRNKDAGSGGELPLYRRCINCAEFFCFALRRNLSARDGNYLRMLGGTAHERGIEVHTAR
jgi:hypothetical protein